ELNRLAIVVGDELAGRETLAISERGQFCILLAAGAGEISHQLLVESGAALHERPIVARGGLEQIGGFPTVAAPVWLQVLLHEFNGIEVTVGEHEPPLVVPVRRYLKDKRGNWHVAASRAGLSRVAGRQLARCHETGAGDGA